MPPSSLNPSIIAKAFVSARQKAKPLEGYPGPVPEALETSYQIQDHAIGLWGDVVAGWKIGRLSPEKQALFGTQRLSGPIFASNVRPYGDELLLIDIYEGGFSAVEAEYVFKIQKDADPNKTLYSESEALGLIEGVYAGIEMAGSPLATINDLGPTVVASDFGNNFGLIIGPCLVPQEALSLEALEPKALEAFKAETEIDGASVGQGGLYTMPEGPLKAIAWLAGHLAARHKPLRQGQWISTGATTGIHSIAPGQASKVRFSLKDQEIILELSTKAYQPALKTAQIA